MSLISSENHDPDLRARLDGARGEAARLESEDRARLAIEAAELGTFRVDLSAGRVELDERARSHLGLTGDSVTPDDIVAVTHPQDRARVREAFLALDPRVSTGRAAIEHRVVHASGEVRWLAVRVHATFTGEGSARRLLRSVATSQDITDRKRADEALRASEERFRIVFDRASVGIALVDTASGRFLRVNARYAEIVGRTVEEMLTTTWRDLTVPDDLASCEEGHRALVSGAAQQLTKEKRYRRKDGTPVWVRLSVSPTRSDGEARSFHVTIVQEISATITLRESEERYRTLIENIDGVVFTTDEEGRVTFASGAVERYGWSPGDLVGRSLFPHVHRDDRARMIESRAERLRGMPAAPFDFRLVDQKGAIHHVQSRTRPLLVDGRVVGLTGVIADLTQQRATEEQLRHAQKMEAVGRLAGGVAHDFNNLLSVIGICAELAMDRLAPDDPLREDLGEIQSAGVRGQALTRQLLAFSRKQLLKPEALDLNALLRGVQTMLGRLLGEDIDITFVPGPLGGTTLADPGQIEQVLMNLVVNARDAMPRGGTLRIETGSLHLDAEEPCASGLLAAGDYVTLSVSDTGAGMDEVTRARMFEPFFTTKEAGKGTGLGLAMVYGIVQQSGGGIDVETAPGAGTTFRIALPTTDRAEARPAAPAAAAVGGSETVLVVEDESALRLLTRRVLVNAGYDVLMAEDADEARRLFTQRADVKLLLTDVVMPRVDGPELAAHLERERPGLRVLYVSGYSSDAVTQRASLAPGIELVQKPFTAEALLSSVRRVLDAPHRPPRPG